MLIKRLIKNMPGKYSIKRDLSANKNNTKLRSVFYDKYF